MAIRFSCPQLASPCGGGAQCAHWAERVYLFWSSAGFDPPGLMIDTLQTEQDKQKDKDKDKESKHHVQETF